MPTTQRKVTATYGRKKKSTLIRQKGANHDVFKSEDGFNSEQHKKDEFSTSKPTLRSRMATPTKHTKFLSKDDVSSSLTESTQNANFEKHVLDDRERVAGTVALNDEDSDVGESTLQSSTLLYPFYGAKQERRSKPARYHTLRGLPEARVLRDLESDRRTAQKTTQQSSDSLEIILPQQCSSDEELEIPNYNSSPLATSTPHRYSIAVSNSVDKKKRKHNDTVPTARYSSLKKSRQEDCHPQDTKKHYDRNASLKPNNSRVDDIEKSLSDPFSDDNMVLCDEDKQDQNEMQVDEQEDQQNSGLSDYSDCEIEIGRREEQPIQDDPDFQLETVFTFDELSPHRGESTKLSQIVKNVEQKERQPRNAKHCNQNQLQAQSSSAQSVVDGKVKSHTWVHNAQRTTNGKILPRKYGLDKRKENGLERRNLSINQSVDRPNHDEDNIIHAVCKDQSHVETHVRNDQQQQQEGSLVQTFESGTKFTQKVRHRLQNRFKRYVLKPIQNMPGNVRTGLSVRRTNTKPNKKAYANAELDELQALMFE